MAKTPDYEDQASSYNLKFSSQSRTPATTAVTSNEMANRDNLLYFIEDKFKTNVKGGFRLENIRAFLHSLVKSVPVLADDKSYGVLMNTSFYISSGTSTRWYYGSQTEGWAAGRWSSYYTGTVNNTSPVTMLGHYSNMGVEVPFDLMNFKVIGTVSKSGIANGEIDIEIFYYDNDNDAAYYLANAVHLCTVPTVMCVRADTGYSFEASAPPNLRIPKGKKIFAFINNARHAGAGTETLKVNLAYQYSRYSDNFTV
mgnify:CR=1 FL=1|tara:strand:+ start:11631 stop:12395 length:765 start_codon:yes stop_codon:yes gene_type:complete